MKQSKLDLKECELGLMRVMISQDEYERRVYLAIKALLEIDEFLRQRDSAMNQNQASAPGEIAA